MSRGIPLPTQIKDPTTRVVVQAIYEALEQLRGNMGTIEDRAITVSDLKDMGYVNVFDTDKLYAPKAWQRAKPRPPVPYGESAVIEVFDPASIQTIVLRIQDGLITNWDGPFEAVNADDGTTIVLESVNGAILGSITAFIAHDPISRDTVKVIVDASTGRIVST